MRVHLRHFVLILCAVGLSPLALAATGGPDAFGYTFVDSLEQGGPQFHGIDISSTGVGVVTGDEASSGPITLGASINFYGSLTTSLNVSTNGYLSTDPLDTGGDLSNDCPLPVIPSTGGGGRIYPLHDDFVVADQVYFESFAVCARPSDRGGALGCSVFMWNDVEHFGGGGQTWDMWAYIYDNGDITCEIGAGNPELGSGSTTGIQNLGATIGLNVACNTPVSVPDNYVVTFLSPDAVGLNILNLHDTGTPNYVVAVAKAIGASLTVVTTQAGFDNAFDMGGWDIVIYSAWSGGAPGTQQLDRLKAFADSGGRVILNAFNTATLMGHPLFIVNCPVTMTGGYETPMPLDLWMPGHDILKFPRRVAPSPITTSGLDSFAFDGQLVTPDPTGSFAVAGFGAPGTPAAAGIIVSCDHTVVYNSFTPQTLAANPTTNLLINEIVMDTGGAIFVWDDTTTSGGALPDRETFVDAARLLQLPVIHTEGDAETQDALQLVRCAKVFVADVGGNLVDLQTLDDISTLRAAESTPTIFGHWDSIATSASLLLLNEGIFPGPQFGMGESVLDWTAGVGALELALFTVPDIGPTHPASVYGAYGHDHASTMLVNSQRGFVVAPTGGRSAVSFGASGRLLYNSFILDQYSTVDNDMDGFDDVFELAVNELFVMCNLGGCLTFCGDCDGNGIGVNVLDALAAAQISAGLVVATPQQEFCCDTNNSGAIEITDSLRMAQSAAGLAIVLVCP